MGPSMQELNAILEGLVFILVTGFYGRLTTLLCAGPYGLPSPDLMIVHRTAPAGQMRWPVELGGFPPWQMRLTEIL